MALHLAFSRLLRSAVLFAAIGLLWPHGPAAAQGLGPQWVFPSFPATPPEERTLTAVHIYNYEESLFAPPVTVTDPIPQAAADYSTPERAMITRVSAMMTGDFDWYQETWDPLSLAVLQEHDAYFNNDSAEYLERWANIYASHRNQLIRRIDSGSYVILTYKMIDEEGVGLMDDMEFPAVFEQQDGQWLASQDLMRDPLPEISPWVQGVSVVEREGR